MWQTDERTGGQQTEPSLAIVYDAALINWSYWTDETEPENVAISDALPFETTRCVVPIVLGFNYEARAAVANNLNNSTTPEDP